MKSRLLLTLILSTSMASLAQAQDNTADTSDNISYALGVDFAQNMKKQDTVINPDDFSQGMKDVAAGGELRIGEEELAATLQAFQMELRAKFMESRKIEAEANVKVSEEFLEKNKEEEGVVALPSGLQYKVITEGEGELPDASATVSVHYEGTLTDGTVFDSSRKRGQPATFPLRGVIKGWTEALQLMKIGSRWQLFIPPELGYGTRGAPPNIGPNAVLIFDVELLEIQ